MGKAAENEKRKLRATFFNNLSVGLLLGGLLIPYLSILPKLPVIIEHIQSGEAFRFGDLATALAVGVSMFLALTGARSFRERVNEIAGTIED